MRRLSLRMVWVAVLSTCAQVRIVDEQGASIANATVQATRVSALTSFGDTSYTTEKLPVRQADSHGLIFVGPKDHLCASANGWPAQTTVRPSLIVLGPPRSVKGVVSPSCPEATVWAETMNACAQRTTKVSHDGHFQLDDLGPGRFILRWAWCGHESYREFDQLRPGITDVGQLTQ